MSVRWRNCTSISTTCSPPRSASRSSADPSLPQDHSEGSTMRYTTISALLLLSLRVDIYAAHAHAFLDHADPRVGNTVKSPPRAVALWFTQNLESAFSTIEILDANGAG